MTNGGVPFENGMSVEIMDPDLHLKSGQNYFNTSNVKLIANALLERETLTKEQIDYLVEHKELPDETSLNDLTVEELREKAEKTGIKGYSKMKKEELLEVLK